MEYRLKRQSQLAVTVTLEGDLTDLSAQILETLARDLAGEQATVSFDCEAVGHVNSPGVRSWMFFVKQLKVRGAIQFCNVPTLLMGYFLMLPNMLAGGRIYSFYASYTCKSCRASDSALVGSQQVEKGTLPRPKCPKCVTPMTSDLDEGLDLDQYLA